NGVAAVQHQVENRRVEYGLELQVLPGRRRAGQDKNAGADDGPDAQTNQAPRTQRLAQSPLRRFRSGDQRIDSASAQQPVQDRLPLANLLAFGDLLDLFLVGAARHGGGPLGFRSRLLAGRALQLLTFFRRFNLLGIHRVFYRQTFVRPAYFSTSFFNPPRSKATTIFASAPSPSRRTMVPLPYF